MGNLQKILIKKEGCLRKTFRIISLWRKLGQLSRLCNSTLLIRSIPGFHDLAYPERPTHCQGKQERLGVNISQMVGFQHSIEMKRCKETALKVSHNRWKMKLHTCSSGGLSVLLNTFHCTEGQQPWIILLYPCTSVPVNEEMLFQISKYYCTSEMGTSHNLMFLSRIYILIGRHFIIVCF